MYWGRREKQEKSPKIVQNMEFLQKLCENVHFENIFSGFLRIPWGKFLGIRGEGVVNKLPRSKVNSFLLFIIFFPWKKRNSGNYSCSFIIVLSCYLQSKKKFQNHFFRASDPMNVGKMTYL